MHLKLFLILFLCLMLTSCGLASPKTITLDKEALNCKVALTKEDRVFNYDLSYGEDEFRFVPINGTVPISFCLKKETSESENSGIVQQFNENSNKPLPLIVAKVLKQCVNQEISTDSNGVYRLHGFLQEGEFALTLNDNGELDNLIIDNINLKVEFN